MNKARRKALREIADEIDDLSIALKALCAEEEDYYDNMPENLQGSEKHNKAEEAVDLLSEAMESLESAIDCIENAID